MSGRYQRSTRLRIEHLERRELLSAAASDLLQAMTQSAAATTSDDYGNTAAQAAQVNLSSTGAGALSGAIEKSGDVDVFRFVAPMSGRMTISQSAASGSSLDSYLYVYNANKQLVARNDDFGGTLNSHVEINVVAGATYYIKAAAYQLSTGSYSVQFSTTPTDTTINTAIVDDYGNTFAQATAVLLSSDASATQTGRINQAGDVDMFSFAATATGQMTITQSATAGSRLDSYLAVYDSNQQLVAQNDDTGTSLNSQVTVSVVAGATYYVKAAAYQTSTGAYSLTLTTDQGNPISNPTSNPTTTSNTGSFQIDVTMSGLTASQQAIVQQAVDRWEQIIVGDLPDVTYGGRVIDDVEIAIRGVTIDGTGNILGQSTATAYRRGSDLPYMGFIQLDTADVAAMQSSGSLLGVLEHEIAHVLGFGVIWSDLGLLSGANTTNPAFTGAQAVAEYNALFGTSASAVPVEAEGGSGTRLSHWDESVFGSELMTGWYNSGRSNAISRITVASMADLGYQVNMAAADTYTRPTSSSTLSTSLVGHPDSYRSLANSIAELPQNRHAERLMALDQIFAS